MLLLSANHRDSRRRHRLTLEVLFLFPLAVAAEHLVSLEVVGVEEHQVNLEVVAANHHSPEVVEVSLVSLAAEVVSLPNLEEAEEPRVNQAEVAVNLVSLEVEEVHLPKPVVVNLLNLGEAAELLVSQVVEHAIPG